MKMPEEGLVIDALGNEVTRWSCSYIVQSEQGTKEKTVYCETWVGALVIALDGLRRMIPEDEDNDWETSEGLPSWLVFPKIVPSGWGYAEHQRLWKVVREAQAEINARIEQRRTGK